MTEISGSCSMARIHAPSSVTGISTATTCGFSRNNARRTSSANSNLPGATGKYVKRPRSRLATSVTGGPASAGGPVSPRITQRLLSQHFYYGCLERLGLLGLACGETLELDGETRHVDAVTHGIALIGGVRHLQKIGDVSQDALFGKRQIFPQNVVLLVALREIDEDLRLQARMNVLGQLKGGGVVVHRGHHSELRIGLDLDASDNRLDISPIVEQRRQARPALLAHTVAFVQDGDAAADHGGH